MNGLYNMLFGVNPAAAVLLKMLNLDPMKIPRFRDCFLRGGEVIVYTRTGGGNREEYQEQNEALAAHPGYLRDHDDDFDATYAWFHFRVPEAHAEAIKAIGEAPEPAEMWRALFERLGASVHESPGG